MNSTRPDLRIDWCSHAAARSAVLRWHYSHAMPAGKLVRVGVWEDARFVGCVLFGRGAAIHIGSPFALDQTQVCELVRVALDKHFWPTSRIITIASKMLRQVAPTMRLIVSFADSAEGHHGGIYQAAGWYFLGGRRDRAYLLNGRLVHPKTCHSRYGYGGQSVAWLKTHIDPNAEAVQLPPKLKYVFPLDAAMRAQIAPLAKPYPKRASEPTSVGTDDQSGQGGATPTRTLQDD